jgi:hypothetical protein
MYKIVIKKIGGCQMNQLKATNAKIIDSDCFGKVVGKFFRRRTGAEVFYAGGLWGSAIPHPVLENGTICQTCEGTFSPFEIVDVIDKSSIGIEEIIFEKRRLV